MMGTPVRLQKYLAQCGVASRRKAEELIASGRVSVDGAIVTDMGVKIDPSHQRVAFDGTLLKQRQHKKYYLLNKPKGYVTTVSDPQGRPIVTGLITDSSVRLFPVGRLDIDTHGALILTNDGELAQKIQHPSHEVKKTYEALVEGRPDNRKLRDLANGIDLEGRRTSPAQLVVVEARPHTTLIRVIIHEGRKRQVRKMFEAIGHRVIDLKRTSYGGLQLGKLPKGGYRRLTPEDLKIIFKKIPLQTKK